MVGGIVRGGNLIKINAYKMIFVLIYFKNNCEKVIILYYFNTYYVYFK
jgi:hypothetical protein